MLFAARWKRPALRVWPAACLIAIVGCDNTAPVDSNAPPWEPAAAPAAEVTLVQKSWDEVVQAAAAHRGKVVVIDVWSTSCPPCMRELPHLVELAAEHPGDIAAITVNIDYIGLPDAPPDPGPAAAFLTQKGITVENVLCTTPDEDVLKALGAASIPVVQVFDREGELVKQFEDDESQYGEGGFTYADHIRPVVEQAADGR